MHAAKLWHIALYCPLLVKMNLNMNILFLHQLQILFTISCDCYNPRSFFCRNKIAGKYFESFFARVNRIVIVMWFEFLSNQFTSFKFFNLFIRFLYGIFESGLSKNIIFVFLLYF